MSRVDIQERQPEAYKAMFGLEKYLANSTIDADLQEIIRIRASLINNCRFCIQMHSKAAKELGVNEGKIAKLSNWQASELFSDKERAALNMTDVITNISAKGLPDDIYREAEKFFSEDELAQLIVLISTINTWNRIGVSTSRS